MLSTLKINGVALKTKRDFATRLLSIRLALIYQDQNALRVYKG